MQVKRSMYLKLFVNNLNTFEQENSNVLHLRKTANCSHQAHKMSKYYSIIKQLSIFNLSPKSITIENE